MLNLSAVLGRRCALPILLLLYGRVSAALVGWKTAPRLWRNP